MRHRFPMGLGELIVKSNKGSAFNLVEFIGSNRFFMVVLILMILSGLVSVIIGSLSSSSYQGMVEGAVPWWAIMVRGIPFIIFSFVMFAALLFRSIRIWNSAVAEGRPSWAGKVISVAVCVVAFSLLTVIIIGKMSVYGEIALPAGQKTKNFSAAMGSSKVVYSLGQSVNLRGWNPMTRTSFTDVWCPRNQDVIFSKGLRKYDSMHYQNMDLTFLGVVNQSQNIQELKMGQSGWNVVLLGYGVRIGPDWLPAQLGLLLSLLLFTYGVAGLGVGGALRLVVGPRAGNRKGKS